MTFLFHALQVERVREIAAFQSGDARPADRDVGVHKGADILVARVALTPELVKCVQHRARRAPQARQVSPADDVPRAYQGDPISLELIIQFKIDARLAKISFFDGDIHGCKLNVGDITHRQTDLCQPARPFAGIGAGTT